MIEQFRSIQKKTEVLDEEMEALKGAIEQKQNDYKTKVSALSKLARITIGLDKDAFKGFVQEPYVIIPSGKPEEWFVAVPKFIRMNLGWLDFTTDTYNVFRINKYMKWLGEIPLDIEKKFKFGEKLPLKVFDGVLLTGKTHQDQAWNRYGQYLTKREGKDKIKVKKGYEFKLLAKLLDDGILPFIPTPVDVVDLREAKLGFELRDYQATAWEKFMEVGAVGVYWAYSAGKTFFGLYAGARIKGQKLVVVPSITLVEQWQERVRKYLPQEQWNEWDIVTYHSFDKLRNKQFALIIFDECQHLPANTFSRFSTLVTKYRMGLSATPYREDGRTDYIFALTGFPLGLSWDELIKLGVLEVPDIRVYIVADWRAKEKKLIELLQVDKKTIIFCDSIERGNRLSKDLEIPFVHGATRRRLEIIKEAEVSIVSRVGDEGLSIPDIQRVIEIDFLFGSRRQEGQRLGRLFHGEDKGEHIILMSEREFEDYGKRLYAIHEKGFKVEVIR